VNYFMQTIVLTALLGGVPVVAGAAQAGATQAATATTDAELAAKVKSQIDADAEFKGNDITVTAAGGVVTLKGVVASPLMRAKVGEITRTTAGVTKVNNKLTLAKK
jgi:osmotically-inducible protein OsmY